ncbi:MAG: hypothetical protein JWP14_3182 [Frankiales bacterium]|nr:hypothetical protein [Frankiales bacterium]
MAIAVDPPLLAETLGQVLARQRGDDGTIASPDQVVVTTSGDDVDADYVITLPADGATAVLRLPSGEVRVVAVQTVGDVALLVAELLDR